jgi:adenylate cyclase
MPASSSVPVEGRSRSLNPILLRFADSKLERRYRDDRLNFRLIAVRVSAIAGVGLWLSFTVLSGYAIGDPSRLLFDVRVTTIVGLLTFCAATFAVKPGRWIEPAGFAMLVFNAGMLTLVLVFMSPASLPYYPSSVVYPVLAVASFVLCGVSFVEGVTLATGTICLFFISVTALRPEPGLLVVFHLAWVLSVVVIAGVGSYMLDRTQHTAWLQEMDLQHAEDQVRSLLHNVLPPSIVARKLAGEDPIVDNFVEASLLFADVVDFTALSARMDSTQVVAMLGDLFSRFDGIIAQHGLEKIKTIGDCYMAAAGIPEPVPGHLNRLAQAALDMLAETNKIRAPDGSPIAVRIGMHAGPVTAGVIGDAKFIFDVWGDTVNTASRMESLGAAGRIQVTDTVRAALADDYDFAGPHMIDVKGKGPTQVWFLQ